MGVDDPQALKAVAMRLAELEYDGEIIEVSPGKYKAPSRGAVAVGVFTRRSNGKNSVILEGDDEAIFVAERNSMHALNGDKVKVLVARPIARASSRNARCWRYLSLTSRCLSALLR